MKQNSTFVIANFFDTPQNLYIPHHGLPSDKEASHTQGGRGATSTSAIKTRTRKKASSAIKRDKAKKKSGGGNNNNNNKADSATTASSMSPALAQWMETNEDTTTADIITTTADDDSIDDGKKKKKSRGKNLSAAEKQIDVERRKQIDSTLDRLQEVLEEKTGNVRDILNVVEELLAIQESSNSNNNIDLRRILLNKQRSNYRLAWVGSDDAICHIGTGLHKVPLARMQEVFLNCIGKNRLEILEVISLFGPFPNIKNTLLGTTKMISTSNNDNSCMMQIAMDSMIDGTGKEILAGTEDNIRKVDLQVAFCDERVIVAVVPSDNDNDNPLDDDGKRVLVFTKEKDLDEKLDELRVS
ncbi:hypothetical protein FRACYDRAFT_257292 [Fragilariopsis cylindrus CCMP1102]|uniref:Uncharacterized protein n=1 Tax=Fragilariopsis cylindrus CCMP1102 TaxID=635003 RepID=A0A1E7EK46_9STRA|nr:hypothetical protein FRACYDRAFT_257292 [Fragilariopsis cylindrus CCMP1102]|eukprot:OEU05923.1 hypothetical protein FRACYDRAFT_257292 [Fragilariopsis cylindrus CCMP1102]